MIRVPRRWTVLVAIMLLAGCASSPKPSGALFLLQQPNASKSKQVVAHTTSHMKPVLVVADVSLAPYLTHDGIIYQTGPNRIVAANHNRWAAPLATQITAGLYGALANGLAGTAIRRPSLAPHPDYRLFIYIDRFQGRYDGKAVISGNWRLFGSKDELLGGQDFAQTTPLQKDGYRALVRALSRGWQSIKQNMVARISEILGDGENEQTSK